MANYLKIQGLAVAGAMSLGVIATQAAYTSELTLTDGSTTVIVHDNGVGDTSPLDGVVAYNGTVGANWIVNFTTGVTYPVLPNSMDLNSIDVSGGAGALTIKFSQTDFGGSAPATVAIGGTTSGTVSYKAYADSANALYGSSAVLFGPVTSGPGSFSYGPLSAGTTPAGTYSLTQEFVITHSSFGSTSFNAELTVPEPSTYLAGLGAMGMLGMFGWRSRK